MTGLPDKGQLADAMFSVGALRGQLNNSEAEQAYALAFR
ncbi:MAG: hypothetical protein OFPI_23570 [Osedax symbiont Rs2]|nr:MAG: hypothetical protein OFPI_23570 [Osedax symbiont Rs2]